MNGIYQRLPLPLPLLGAPGKATVPVSALLVTPLIQSSWPPFLGLLQLRPLSHTVNYRCGLLLRSSFPQAVTGTEILSHPLLPSEAQQGIFCHLWLDYFAPHTVSSCWETDPERQGFWWCFQQRLKVPKDPAAGASEKGGQVCAQVGFWCLTSPGSATRHERCPTYSSVSSLFLLLDLSICTDDKIGKCSDVIRSTEMVWCSFCK